MTVVIRTGLREERRQLEELQRRSSMHDPMYREQLVAHPNAIDLPPDQIAAGLVRVAEEGGTTVGFATLLEPVDGACELDALFVEPEQMRNGIGRRLIKDAIAIARRQGAVRIEVVANPQALAFYKSVGFRTVGEAVTRFGSAPRMSLRVR